MAGGARPGSGRKRAQIDEKRMITLINQGVTMAEIARRFGVSRDAIKYAVKNPVKAIPSAQEDRTATGEANFGKSQG